MPQKSQAIASPSRASAPFHTRLPGTLITSTKLLSTNLTERALMASAIDITELIARPLDVIARLRVELKARGNSNNNDNSSSGEQEESALLAAAISEALCSGASPALDEVPVLCRDSLAEVCIVRCRVGLFTPHNRVAVSVGEIFFERRRMREVQMFKFDRLSFESRVGNKQHTNLLTYIRRIPCCAIILGHPYQTSYGMLQVSLPCGLTLIILLYRCFLPHSIGTLSTAVKVSGQMTHSSSSLLCCFGLLFTLERGHRTPHHG